MCKYGILRKLQTIFQLIDQILIAFLLGWTCVKYKVLLCYDSLTVSTRSRSNNMTIQLNEEGKSVIQKEQVFILYITSQVTGKISVENTNCQTTESIINNEADDLIMFSVESGNLSNKIFLDFFPCVLIMLVMEQEKIIHCYDVEHRGNHS